MSHIHLRYASVSSRPSQNPAYWTTEFELTPDDIQFLLDYLVERDRPVADVDMAKALIEHRLRREEQRIQRQLAQGRVYQPQEDYREGETVVFPLFDYAVGTVVGKRPGKNPEHGDFNVILVKFPGQSQPRQFAAALKTPHKLNQAGGNAAQPPSESAETIFKRYGAHVRQAMAAQLQAKAPGEFVNLGHFWLPTKSLADVHIGHLNIAEAMIEFNNRPMATAELIPELGLPKEIPQSIVAFSLDRGLANDPRFVDVGVDSRQWYLQRLLPEEAVTIPRRLQHFPDAFNRSVLSVPLLELEWELDDEWTEGGPTSISTTQQPRVTLALIYPHRRSGTLPLSSRTRGFFPVREGKRSLITFIDGRWGKRFPGWVMPDGRYVCGLGAWYEEHKLPVGAYILLERTEVPGEVVVDFRPHRLKRDWVRVARVERGQLSFIMLKHAISADYDDELVVAEADPAATDELRRELYTRNVPLAELVHDIAVKLMGLSTQGTVHAKTVYSAVNLVRRTAPGPIFAALVTNPRFQALSGNLFALARG